MLLYYRRYTVVQLIHNPDSFVFKCNYWYRKLIAGLQSLALLHGTQLGIRFLCVFFQNHYASRS